MKPRHPSTTTQRTNIRSKSAIADIQLPSPRLSRTPQRTASNERSSTFKNLELRDSERGRFLVFRTNEGETFALNLDCQEEYGFEARMVLQQWAAEQD